LWVFLRDCGTHSLQADLQIYREWLLATLATYPDRNIAENTELVLDGYDVVDKREYPPQDRLTAGDSDAYDVVMMTGSSASDLIPG
jgi:hypothetical protein